MEFLSEYDYAELKGYTIEQLYEYLKAMEEESVQHSIRMLTLSGQELDDARVSMNGYNIWISEYKKEITLRLAIKTPPPRSVCVGCEENQPNQMAHFGGCIPDPNTFNIEE